MNTQEQKIGTPEAVDKAWRGACRVLLGRDVGPIDKYSTYLQRFVEGFRTESSALSGKPVSVSGDYGNGAKFISGDEIRQYSSMMEKQPLDINSIKDIDSIVNGLKERTFYSGSDVLGISSEVNESNRVVDSSFVYRAHDVFYSKYIAYTYLSKYSDYIFGCESVGKETHFAIKSFETYEDSRLMECVRVYVSSDCTYSANLENCQNCLFSFNLRSKRKCIGNLELPEAKFSELKAKLLEEIAQILESEGSLPSIVEIIGGD